MKIVNRHDVVAPPHDALGFVHAPAGLQPDLFTKGGRNFSLFYSRSLCFCGFHSQRFVTLLRRVLAQLASEPHQMSVIEVRYIARTHMCDVPTYRQMLEAARSGSLIENKYGFACDCCRSPSDWARGWYEPNAAKQYIEHIIEYTRVNLCVACKNELLRRAQRRCC